MIPENTDTKSTTRSKSKTLSHPNNPNPIEMTPGEAKSPIKESETTQSSQERQKRLSDQTSQISLKDFQIIKSLGNGAYGKVNLVKWTINNTFYAMKTLDKARIKKFGKVDNVFREKEIMYELDHPNICKLECAFHDDKSLYFILEYAPNGDLSGLIKKEK